MSSQSQSRSDTNYDSTSANEDRVGHFSSLHQRHPQYFNNNNNNITAVSASGSVMNNNNNGNGAGNVPVYQRQSASLHQQGITSATTAGLANTINNRGGAATTTPLSSQQQAILNAANVSAALIKPSRRLAGQTPEIRASRAHSQLLLWVPFLLLLLHKQNEIAAATNNYVTVTTVFTCACVAGPLMWYNEFQDGYRFPTYLVGALCGFVWGIVREIIAVECSMWVRPISVLWFCFVASKLRVSRDVKRITPGKRNLHVPLYHRVWNFVERNVGISPFFFVGEVLSILAQPGGLGQLLDGAFGTFAFVSCPALSVMLGRVTIQFLSKFSDFIPGATQHHSNASRTRTVMTILVLMTSTAIFFFLMWGFVSGYMPFVWQHDQFMGVYMVMLEFMMFNYLKEESRAQRRDQQTVMYQQQQQFGGR